MSQNRVKSVTFLAVKIANFGLSGNVLPIEREEHIMLETLNTLVATLPDWSLAVLAVSIGWAAGTALLFFAIEWFGW